MDSLSLIHPENTEIEPPKKKVRVLGIDLGTTNSTVAEVVYDPKVLTLPPARCIEIEQYTTDGDQTHLLVPSVIAFHGGRQIIGEGAKRLRARSTEFGLVQNVNLFYECKNDIGIRKTYHKAAEGYRSAAEVGGHLICFLREAALKDSSIPLDRVVVTVPASFQAAQRNDTLVAASLAGLEIKGGDLLDEPVAAFIDYMASHAGTLKIDPDESKRLMIFDFGGGTCDVAVFALSQLLDGGRLNISPLAVSRYHRLGGGDIDLAILHDELIPQIIQQNGLGSFSLSFNDKKRFIEPSLIGIAEALKIGLCREISRLVKFGKYASSDKGNLVKTQPGQYVCRMADGSELKLQTPRLSALRFEEILEAFLDRDLLYARETEYRTTCSIFAPIQDALERSGLVAKAIDYCLLVGGSCLIPQVEQAIGAHFTNAQLLTYPDPDSIQAAVARGAAYHALSLALYGRGIIQPICHDSIAVMTGEGPLELISKGTVLPFPANGSYAKNYDLVVPKTSLAQTVPLRLEVVAGVDNRILLQRIWEIDAPVNQGEKLCLEYRYDENQCLDLRMRLADKPEMEPFRETLENPLTNVVNPQKIRLKIEELEENIRIGKIPAQQQPETFVELAESYAELRQHEKALQYLSGVLQIKNKPDAEILNKMAIYCGEMGDYERQEKLYREAANASSWVGPWFNLALLQKNRKKYKEALESINKAIEKDSKPPQLVLRAQIYEATGKTEERGNDLDEALTDFDQPSRLDDWSLGWLLTAARMSGDKTIEKNALAEQRSRKGGIAPDGIGGILPGRI